MDDDIALGALTAGIVGSLLAITDALIDRDPGLRMAIEERLEGHIAHLAAVRRAEPTTPGGHVRNATVPRMLLTLLRETNPNRPQR